ncbi:MAG: hypothetical protein KF851_07340 [Pirellulaceae bacterium]|nr:hypothetical protein [Pirellulaceae bacterium]
MAGTMQRPSRRYSSLTGIDNVSVTLVNIQVRRTTFTPSNLANKNVSQIDGAAKRDTATALPDQFDFSYDEASRLISASDLHSAFTFQHDNLNRVISETQNFSASGLTPHVKLTRGYDLVGNRPG